MKKLLSRALCALLSATMLFGAAACAKKPGSTDDAGAYTYNLALTVFPTNWNPHTYQTNDDAVILDYISQGFYTFDYNDTKDGYQLVPAMATEEPIDVTSEYVGKYGVKEGETGKVYRIPLRNDIKWEDGTEIKAADFETSAKLLLNPKAHNYRADSLYSGSMVIANANNYSKQDQDIKEPNSTDGENFVVAIADLVKGADGVYTYNDKAVYFGLKTAYAWMGGDSLEQYKGYFPDGVYAQLEALADDEGNVPVTDQSIDLLYQFTGSDIWGNESKEDLAYYITYQKHYSSMDWSEVGLFASGEYELTIALEKSLSGFYLLYALTDSWLVNETLYKSCEKVDGDAYTNSYGTTVDTTMSYGPYKLTGFQSDKLITLDKNEHWYGYNDEENKDLYQTTNISMEYIPEASTRLEMFINGQLDSYVLTKDDMDAYSKSEHTYYTTGESTFFIALNPNFGALETAQAAAGANKNKTILTIKEFRMALSFALDRSAFCLATSPTNNAAFGVYSNFIISDPDAGIAYRTTPQAKQVIANFWDLNDDIGDGKMYPTIDDAIASLTGYNLAQAQEYFNKAYDEAIKLGYMDEDDVVEIKIGLPNNTSPFYTKGYDFLVNNYTEAVKGTKLEGKLTFTQDASLGNGFGDALRGNQVDMLFGVGWTGSALDPYNLMEAYTSSSYQYDPSWDTTATMIEIKMADGTYKASVWDWTTAIMGEEITITNTADGTTKSFSAGSASNDHEIRLDILAALENAVLETYDLIPMMDESTASLKGMQVKYYTEEYIYGVGRGGVKYMTYNYTDEEWTAFVKAQGGTLNYK